MFTGNTLHKMCLTVLGKMDALLKEENEPKHLVQQLAEIFLPILNGNPKILDFWKLQYIKGRCFYFSKLL